MTSRERNGLMILIQLFRFLPFSRYCAGRLMENSFSRRRSSCGNDSFSMLKISFFSLRWMRRVRRVPPASVIKNPAEVMMMYEIAAVDIERERMNITWLKKNKRDPQVQRTSTADVLISSLFLPFAPTKEINNKEKI